MNVPNAVRRMLSESREAPERDRQFDAIVLATATILMAIAFWLHLRDHGEVQANNHTVHVHDSLDPIETQSALAHSP